MVNTSSVWPMFSNVVEQIFPSLEMEVACLARLIRHFTDGAVVGVLAAVACGDGGPEVVQNVAVGMPALAGGESDLPNANPIVLAEQPRSDVAVVGMFGEFGFQPVGPALEIAGDEFTG